MRHALSDEGACVHCGKRYPWGANECLAERARPPVDRSKLGRRYGDGAAELRREMETRAALGTTPLTMSEWVAICAGEPFEPKERRNLAPGWGRSWWREAG